MPPRRTWPNWSTSRDWQRHGPLGRGGSFGDHHDRGEATLGVSGLEVAADLIDVEWLLGDEDLGRAAGDSGVGRDPSGVPPHHLADDHAIVGLGGGVQPVDGLRGDLHGGVKAEGDLGAGEVVVDRLRHPDDGNALAGQLLATPSVSSPPMATRASMRSVRSVSSAFDHAAVDLVGIGPRRAEDGAAARQDAAATLDVEGHGAILDHAPPAVEKPHELVIEGDLAPAHHGADDRVEARAVTSACEHTNSHWATSSRSGSSPRTLAPLAGASFTRGWPGGCTWVPCPW